MKYNIAKEFAKRAAKKYSQKKKKPNKAFNKVGKITGHGGTAKGIVGGGYSQEELRKRLRLL